VSGKRVLIVIANHHFFFREYGDPRQELERAGIRVTVAAGRKAVCRPHEGSGQGPDGGSVQADLALSEVNVTDFDAVLFSGGWGASSYQFAFNGRYNDASYNGDRAIKTEANRVINEFVKQDKYVAALCNGVSVLAWARVDGKSPLSGKRVCAPVRQAPPGVYNGRPGQPSCRWHPESNGAILSPAGTIGQPGNAADDVLVDGKIITGEDDISAREMGRRLVEVLTRPTAAATGN
jgi:putative intracellular protease/amidase